MTDHQTHSQNPDDAGKPPNDSWDGSYPAGRPSVHPAWLGPKPAGPTAHYWVNADGSVVRTAVDTGDAGFRAGDVVRVVNGRIVRSLPDQVGPGHDDPRAGIVSTVQPNTGPPPSITWADVKALMDKLLPPAHVVPSVRVCQCDDDDCGGTCAGSRRPEPAPCPPEPDWHKGCTWCWRTIWHTTNPPTTGEQP